MTTAVPDANRHHLGNRVTVIVVPTDDGAAVKWIGAPEMEVEGCA